MNYPKQILIESTSRCNLHCKGCLVGTTPPQDMEWGLMEQIIKDNNGRSTIIPYMYSEPTLYPRIYGTAQLSIDSGARFYIATNGMMWRQDLFELMTEENGAYQIIFSVDSIYPEKQKICRPGSNLDAILYNIERFAALRNSKGHNIDIAIKLIERGQDFAEIENFVTYWLSHRYVDYVAVGRMLNAKTEKGMRHTNCLYPNGLYICITVNGDIVPCMYNLEGYKSRVLGNIRDMTIEEAYNSPMFWKWRQDQNFKEPCETCGFAYTGSGMTGTMKFQLFDHTKMSAEKKKLGELHIKTDYYNTFFSRANKETEGAMSEWGNRNAHMETD